MGKNSFGQGKRLLFYRLMRDFIKDGIPVYDALREIEKRSKTLKMFPPAIIKNLMLAMRGQNGRAPRTLGESLREWVPPVEAALIDAGEQAGRLGDGLGEVTNLIEAKTKITGAIVGAMVYPVILLLMLGGFLAMVSMQLIPVMEDILPRAKWPAIGRFLGWVSDHSVVILVILFGSIFGIAGAFGVSATRWSGVRREWADRFVPPWSIYLEVQAAMILTALSMLIAAGVPVSAALAQMHAIGSNWQRHYLERIQGRMRRGMQEADAIAGEPGEGSMFDAWTAWEIKMYGSRTSFAQSLKALASRAMERLEKRIRLQFGILRNVLLVVVAGMLGMTFASFMQVTMSVSKQANAF